MIKFNKIDALLSSPDQSSSIIELDDFICELCGWGSKLDVLTDAQKVFFYTQSIEREVNNGGFSLYFTNSSGGFAHETVAALKLIGANHTADLLQAAIDLFPEGCVPKDGAERKRLATEMGKSAQQKWDELDQVFFNIKII